LDIRTLPGWKTGFQELMYLIAGGSCAGFPGPVFK
jgi:hypothetical protein